MPTRHARTREAFQKNVDPAVSKTINFPAEATVVDVREAFLPADTVGCQVLTVYRNRSRDSPMLNVRDSK